MVNYGNVIPDNGDGLDLDADGFILGSDLVIMRSFILSAPLGGPRPRPLDPAAHPRLLNVSRDARAALLARQEKPGKEIALFGGGELFRSLLAEGVVDTVEVAVIPVLLGGGIPLLASPGPRAKLRLTGNRVYEKTGTVLLEYEGSRGAETLRRRSRPPRATRRAR
jgi:hypothetical protein